MRMRPRDTLGERTDRWPAFNRQREPAAGWRLIGRGIHELGCGAAMVRVHMNHRGTVALRSPSPDHVIVTEDLGSLAIAAER